MPLYTRSERVKNGEVEYWKGNAVEHRIGERRESKAGIILTLLEEVGIYAIQTRKTYIAADPLGNKMTVNPEAWDMMELV